jgi:hypothetical protein
MNNFKWINRRSKEGLGVEFTERTSVTDWSDSSRRKSERDQGGWKA